MLLQETIIYLGAATLAVVLSRKLGFGSVLGYLLAGVLIGPWGFRLVTDVERIFHFAEIGVVFLLFIIGLELQPSRLWLLRRSVFGLGMLQVMLTGSILSIAAYWLLQTWSAALLVGFGLSLSSTPFVLQMLAERKELASAHGRTAFGVLLFQDLAVIPLIALAPLLAATELQSGDSFSIAQTAKTALIVVGFVIGARYVLRPLFRLVASAQIHEIFTAAALLLVIGTALLMQSLGLSMALGAFLAGILVADSEYRHQLETDIEPFKGLLLGLFFMAVGMSAELGLIFKEPLIILALTGGLIFVKAVILFPLARGFRLENNSALKLAAILSQGGEFAFVIFNLAAAEGLLSELITDRLVLSVTLSMAATPLLYIVNQKFLEPAITSEEKRPFDAMEDRSHEVFIAGFGRFGQIVGRVLAMRNICFTALEISAAQVDFVRRYGSKIYYGDAARVDLLRAARVDQAKVFVLAVDDVESSVKIAETVTRHFPHLKLLARARNRQHAFRLMDLGAKVIVRDTLLSSLFLAGETLKNMGLSPEDARRATEFFEQHDAETLEKQHAIHTDENALMQSAREASRDLAELFEADART